MYFLQLPEKHLIFSDMLARPAWWTPMLLENGRYDQNSVEYVYLGLYSDKKYLLLMEVTGVGDWTDLDDSERRIQALKLKRYLEKMKAEGNTVYEDSYSGGVPEEMSVQVMG